MIRVLHIVDTLYQKSGIANVIMNYYKNISREKVQFDFLITINKEHTFLNEIKTYGGNIYYMPQLNINNFYSFYKSIDDFFMSHGKEFDIIHSHYNQLDSIIFPIAKKYGIKECISHSHNTKYSDSKIRSIRNWLMCLPLKKNATKWLACSKDAGNFLFGKEFSSSSKSFVLNNAIECQNFVFSKSKRDIKRKELGLENKLVIGHVGRFNKQKNHDFLINVFNKVKEKNNNSVLVLVGDGPLFDDIRNQVTNHDLTEYVIFLGQRKDIADIMQAFDIFVFPSLFEGLGIVLIEAQAADLPCIYSNVIPSEVNILENNIALDLNDNYDLWASEILRHISHKRRSNVIMQIEEAGFSIKKEAIKLVNFYMSLA